MRECECFVKNGNKPEISRWQNSGHETQYGPSLKKEENLVKYKDRYVYIKRIEQQNGTKNHEAYVYLGYDVDRGSDETHKALKRARKQKTSLSEVHKDLQDSGIFYDCFLSAFSGGWYPARLLRKTDG